MKVSSILCLALATAHNITRSQQMSTWCYAQNEATVLWGLVSFSFQAFWLNSWSINPPVFHCALYTPPWTLYQASRIQPAPRQTQPATRPGTQKQLQPANGSHMITHQQTSPILPQMRSRYIPPPHPHNRLRQAYYSYNYIGFIYNLKMADNLGRKKLL